MMAPSDPPRSTDPVRGTAAIGPTWDGGWGSIARAGPRVGRGPIALGLSVIWIMLRCLCRGRRRSVGARLGSRVGAGGLAQGADSTRISGAGPGGTRAARSARRRDAWSRVVEAGWGDARGRVPDGARRG